MILLASVSSGILAKQYKVKIVCITNASNSFTKTIRLGESVHHNKIVFFRLMYCGTESKTLHCY